MIEKAPRVAVWRTALLPGSETFIRNQVNAISRWSPVLVGAVREESALTRDSDRLAFGSSRADQLRYRVFRAFGHSSRVTRALKEIDPSLIHAHFAPDGWRVLRSARSLGVPLVVTLHGHDVTKMPRASGRAGKRARRRLAELFKNADLLIAVSEFIRQEAIACGADPDKIRVHHIGVPVRGSNQPVEKKWDIVFVGRFVDKKGISDLIAALELLHDDFSPKVALIGDGPLKTELMARAEALGLDATFLGSQPPSVVESTLRDARIFVGPSKTAPGGDSEGFGMVFLEAALAGIPSVAYVHGGVPEAVDDGVTGLLGAEGDVAALAGNIRRLLEDEELRAALGMAGRDRAEKSFSIDKQTEQLEHIYDSVLRASSTRKHRG